jgi:hypothetical protein
MATPSAGWKGFVVYACHLMSLSVVSVVDYVVNTRVRYFVSWFKGFANFSHGNPPWKEYAIGYQKSSSEVDFVLKTGIGKNAECNVK